MTAMFDRQGKEVAGPFVARKGGVGVNRIHRCNRCGGAGGSSKWDHTGWTCFDCGGSGQGHPYVMPVYTAEKLVTLNATKAKADAKRTVAREAKAAADAARADAERAEFMAYHAAFFAAARPFCARIEFVDDIIAKAEQNARISSGQIDAVRGAIVRQIVKDQERAAAMHLGEVGVRRSFEGEVISVASYGSQWDAYGVSIVTIVRTASGCVSYRGGRRLAAEGARVRFSAEVKDHRERRNGEPLTVVKRPTKIEVIGGTPRAAEGFDHAAH
jgi:ribosomal protein L37AE/L43A